MSSASRPDTHNHLELDDTSYLRTIPEDGDQTDNSSNCHSSPAFQFLPPVSSSSMSPHPHPQRAFSSHSSTRGALNGTSEHGPEEEQEGRGGGERSNNGDALMVRTNGGNDVGVSSADPSSWRGGVNGAVAVAAGGTNGLQRQRAHRTRMLLLTDWGDLGKKTKRIIVVSILFTGLLLLAIILIVVLTRRSAAKSSTTTNNNNGNSSSNNDASTLSPAPTPSPSVRAQIDAVLLNVTAAVDLKDPNTPQYKARQWMLEQDLLLNDVLADGDARVAQRYACAELLFAMHVANDTDFDVLDDNDDDNNNNMLGNSNNNNDDDDDNGLLDGDSSSSADHTLAQTLLKRDQSECEWLGFACARDMPGHVVIGINLAGLKLTGSLPSEIAQLPHLQNLTLTANSIWGSIPNAWFDNNGALQELNNLDLGNNDLSGTIPSQIWTHFPRLEFLYLNHNDFRGPIVLGSVATTTTAAAPWTNEVLRDIWLDHNALTGSFPSWILQEFYPSLETLKLDGNNLTGPLPQDNDSSSFDPNNSSTNWPSTLSFLDLSSNQLTGLVPPSLFFLAPSLVFLDLSDNLFSGHLPNSTSYNNENQQQEQQQPGGNKGEATSSPYSTPSFFSFLRTVKLHSNQFSGMLPPDFGSSWTNLMQLTLHDNDLLTGSISTDLCEHWTNLKNLSVDCDLVQCACCPQCN